MVCAKATVPGSQRAKHGRIAYAWRLMDMDAGCGAREKLAVAFATNGDSAIACDFVVTA